ncbi:MAG: toll/interleukin-1 receptor domain-containing protein [Saprospiraceae bacterium]|nr:toll/interleukin-1 receptor domain-containing protein [Saprospiraceae bacterium]
MGKSVLVFISHSSEDKATLIEPIVTDLESCYINVWYDKRKIVPGDNLRKSILRDGLDKADIVLIFFTTKSLSSAWVDREVKHVLREEIKNGNNLDLRKIIAIFDSKETYEKISERYPELTDDLMHLMPSEYSKTHLGQLVSAIWSKYLALQGGDLETQRQLLLKDKEIFQKEKEIEKLSSQIKELKSKENNSSEFEYYFNSGKINDFIKEGETIITKGLIETNLVKNAKEALALGLLEIAPGNVRFARLTKKGTDFFKWKILNDKI